MITTMIYITIILLLTTIFVIYFIATQPLAIPYLKCKLKKKSLLIICGEDGGFRLIPTESNDIAILRNYGAWAFDRSSKYTLEGITCFFGYVKGPAMTTNIQTYIAAAKLKHMGITPELSLFQTIKKAQTKDDFLTKQAFFDFLKTKLSKNDIKRIESEYKQFYEEETKRLSEEYFQNENIPEFQSKIMQGYNVNMYIAEKLPTSAIDYYISTLPESELNDLLEEAKILPNLTPVDLTALYEFAGAQNGHVVNAKIQRGISEYIIKNSPIGSKITMQTAIIAVMVLIGIGVVAYLVLNGSAGNLVSSLTPTPSILPTPTPIPNITVPM